MMKNVDPDEINKFSEHAARWWDKTGEIKTLHHINPARLDYILSTSTVNAKKILDVGCGGGILSESLARSGGIVTGIDMNPALINVANLHLAESGLNVDYHFQSVESLAESEAANFDIVTCMELLEHVPDPYSIINACARLLKPGGQLYLSTINRHPKAYLFAILGAEYLLRLLPKNTHDYAKFIRPSELTDLVTRSGLSPREMKGMAYNPLTQQASLSDDVSVNYLLRAEKP